MKQFQCASGDEPVEIFVGQKYRDGMWHDRFFINIGSRNVLDAARRLSQRVGVKLMRINVPGGWEFDARAQRKE